MRISPIQKTHLVNFSENQSKPEVKKKYTFFTAGSLAVGSLVVGGALLLSKFNKTMLLKDSTVNLAKFNKKKLLDLCKSALPENYVSTVENLKNKVFRIDLHSHSNHSDGWASVESILNQAVTYGNELYEKTGKKFTFALTDHDRVSGVREALQIIKSNPDKFKNIDFIPGVELSFVFNSNGQIKSGELLAYFINPDSPAMFKLVEELNQSRLKMIDDLVKNLGDGFCRSDLDNYFLNKDGETFAYNLHHRLRNYAQIKNRINNMAKIWHDDPNHLYKYFMDRYVFENGRVPKPFVTPEGFDAFLRRSNVYTETQMIDDHIDKLCQQFFPKLDNGYVVSETENSFEKIIDSFKNEENVVLSFAHPYFTAKQMSDYKKEFDNLLRYAKGRIQLSENYHQAYSSSISKSEINQINEYLLSKNLIPMGGRDNHSDVFIPTY